MTDSRSDLGTATWVQQTAGWLTPAEGRSLVRPLARTHAQILVGRVSAALHLNSGRRAYLPAGTLSAPSGTALTQAAEHRARTMMPTALVNHSYRSYLFGRAIGKLDGIPVDDELLFAAAMLHDTGLVGPAGSADFTLTSARTARDVAEEVGLSSTASQTLQTAITLHHSPGLTLAAGPVAYLLSAGAGLDVVGLRSWKLPPDTLATVVAAHPRENFKQVFGTAFRTEAARVPRGRTRFLYRYGAFGAAVRLAPFDS